MAMSEEITRLRNQVLSAKKIILAGVELMTTEQISEWEGVRGFLEMETNDYPATEEE